MSEATLDKRLDSDFFSKNTRAARLITRSRENKSLSDLAEVADGDHSVFPDEKGGTIRYLQAKDFDGFVNPEAEVYVTQEYFDRNRRSEIGPNNILFSIMGTVGRVALTDSDFAPCMANRAVGIIRPRAGISHKLLFAFLGSNLTSSSILGYSSGGVQKRINLDLLRSLSIPKFSSKLTSTVERVVELAFIRNRSAIDLSSFCESELLGSLGLKDWKPPEPLTYKQKVSVVLAAGRCDAEFFSPRVADLLTVLRKSELTIKDVALSRQEQFTPTATGQFQYIEIGDLRRDGSTATSSIEMAEAPSRAAWYVRSRDVITSTVRPIRRLTAIIDPEQSGAVCSSGFVVLKPKSVAAEVLLTYLRLAPVCELMDLHTSTVTV